MEYKLLTCTEKEIKKLSKKITKSKLDKIPIIGKYIKQTRMNKLNEMFSNEIDAQINVPITDYYEN